MTTYSLVGESLGGWRIRDHIGQGGQGSLYFCTKPGIDGSPIRGAMKTLTLAGNVSGDQRQRIVHELDMLKSADSPYLPKVYDSGMDILELSGTKVPVQYIVMEFVNGDNLYQEIKEHGVTASLDWWNLAHDLTMALAILHEKGIVHADVKPQNVMRGARKTMLVDLGGASLVGLADPGDAGLMTPGWAAPEQYRRDIVDPEDWGYEVDVFCLGQLLVFAGTGHAPWDYRRPRLPQKATERDIQLVWAKAGLEHADRMVQTPPRLDGLTEDQSILVRQMLAIEPSHRKPTAELLELIRQQLPEGSERKTGVIPQAMRWTPQTNGNRITPSGGGTWSRAPQASRIGDWRWTFASFLFPFGMFLRYLYLDSREAWRYPQDRGEFRFVAVSSVFMTLGFVLPFILYRWWLNGADDFYRIAAFVSSLTPVLFIASMIMIPENGEPPWTYWVFLPLFFGGAVFVWLIPAAALNSQGRRKSASGKQRFV